MWIINLPLRVPVSKKRDFSLNLNQYRNAHFHVLDKAKKNFDEMVQPLIKAQAIPSLTRCSLEYTLYPGTAQLCDVNNVCTIADKFFSDSLVAAHVVPDDNYKFIVESHFKFGQVDRVNPRIQVVIRGPDHTPTVPPPQKENTDMKIQTITTAVLTEEDMRQAITEFLQKHAGVSADAELYIGDPIFEGFEELEIRITQAQPLVSTSTSTTGRGRKPRAEPKEAMSNVNAELERKRREEEKAAAKAAAAAEDSEEDETQGKEQDSQPEEQVAEAEAEEAIHKPNPQVTGHTEPPEEKGHAEPAPTDEIPPPAPKKKLFGDFTRPKNG